MRREEFLERLERHNAWYYNRDSSKGERLSLRHVDLDNMDLSNLYLRGVVIEQCSLKGVNLDNSRLNNARFSGCRMVGASLQNTNLYLTDLRSSTLQEANLTKASLIGTNFACCSMENVNLTNVRLYDTIGNGEEIKSINVGKYEVSYTATDMSIGCQLYPIKEWWDLPYEEFEDLVEGDVTEEEWEKYKQVLKGIIEVFPATPYRRGETSVQE